MTPELKARWVQALRSGDYKQGLRQLRNDDRGSGNCTYCCLGVLADLINPDGWLSCGNWMAYDDENFIDDNSTSHDPIPHEILAPVDQKVFINMNDNEGASFDDIADYVERANLAVDGIK